MRFFQAWTLLAITATQNFQRNCPSLFYVLKLLLISCIVVLGFSDPFSCLFLNHLFICQYARCCFRTSLSKCLMPSSQTSHIHWAIPVLQSWKFFVIVYSFPFYLELIGAIFLFSYSLLSIVSFLCVLVLLSGRLLSHSGKVLFLLSYFQVLLL